VFFLLRHEKLNALKEQFALRSQQAFIIVFYTFSLYMPIARHSLTINFIFLLKNIDFFCKFNI